MIPESGTHRCVVVRHDSIIHLSLTVLRAEDLWECISVMYRYAWGQVYTGLEALFVLFTEVQWCTRYLTYPSKQGILETRLNQKSPVGVALSHGAGRHLLWSGGSMKCFVQDSAALCDAEA